MEQKDLATVLGVSRSAIANWETSKSNIAPQHMEKILELFPYAVNESELPRLGGRKWKIKQWGAISAGDGNATSPDFEDAFIPSDFDRDDYGAMLVQGDSMMPFLLPSDMVIFRDWKKEKIGHIMAAVLPDGDWVVKTLVYDSGAFKLRSLNDSYPDISMNGVRIAGFLVGIIRDEGYERMIRLNPQGLKPS